MTQEERKARAEARKAADRARWQQEREDRALMLDALRDILKDKTANPGQRLFAVAVLDYAESYHMIPCSMKYPDSKDDTDLIDVRAKLAAAIQSAESNT